MSSFKVWGTSYGVIGDLIMGLPILNYFEKKYPKSYKYWVIEKKCAISAPVFLNHPLIDRIKITDEWSGFGKVDKMLMESCDVVAKVPTAPHHDRYDWYNVRSCVEETAIMAGFPDIKDILTEEELKPMLSKWFDVGLPNTTSNTYSKTNKEKTNNYEKNIAIWPYATGGLPGRSPSARWWFRLIKKLSEKGYTVSHYGRSKELPLSNLENYKRYTSLSFFDQIKASLASEIVLGPDTGPMWIMGAYSHPAINLMTNHMKDHDSNLLALAPINENAINLFSYYKSGIGCDGINTDLVVENIINFNKEKE